MALLSAQKAQIEQTVHEFFEQIVRQVEEATLSEDRLLELERREEKIAKGSVKALIQHYSEDYPLLKFPKVEINFSAERLDGLLRGFAWIEREGTGNSRPGSAGGPVGTIQYQQRLVQHFQGADQHQHQQQQQHPQTPLLSGQHSYQAAPSVSHSLERKSEQRGLSFHSVINKEPAGAPEYRPVDPNKCLDYSPTNTLSHPPSFMQQRTPTPVYTHTMPPESFSPHLTYVNPHPTQSTPLHHTPVDYVSPIQKLQTQERIVRPASDYERKENVDVNRMATYLDKTVTTTTSTNVLQSLATTDTIQAATLTSAHITSKSVPKPEDILRTFRPSSAHNKAAAYRDTLKTESSSSKLMTNKILSPEEIKAMMKRGNNEAQQVQTKQQEHQMNEITYVRQTDVSREMGAPHFRMLGHDMELKQSYFDQNGKEQFRPHAIGTVPNATINTVSYSMPADKEQRQVSNFSPEFRQEPMSWQEQPYEIKVFKPIEGSSLGQNSQTEHLYGAPQSSKAPYEIKYKGSSSWDSKILSVEDLRAHLSSTLEAANR